MSPPSKREFRRAVASGPRKRRARDGGRMRSVATHPPEFVSAPWYNLVVRLDQPPTLITTITLQQAIASQLTITFTGGLIDVRFQSVRIWGALQSFNSSTTLQPVVALIFDPLGSGAVISNGTGPRVLEQITDYPDLVRRAAVGYNYPKAQRETSVRLSGSPPLATLLNVFGLGAGSVVYFNVQWRPAPPIAPVFGDTQAVDEALSSFVDLTVQSHNLLSCNRCQ